MNVNCKCGKTGGCDDCVLRDFQNSSIVDINKVLEEDEQPMTNKTPDRSVEEIVEEFHIKLLDLRVRLERLVRHGEMSDAENVERGIKNTSDWLTQTLQTFAHQIQEAERERIEKHLNDDVIPVIVREERERIVSIFNWREKLGNTPSNDDIIDYMETCIEALTHPNNPNQP